MEPVDTRTWERRLRRADTRSQAASLAGNPVAGVASAMLIEATVVAAVLSLLHLL